jgi:hypothetical protein
MLVAIDPALSSVVPHAAVTTPADVTFEIVLLPLAV